MSSDLPLPFIYPTLEAQVLLEWTFGIWEVAAEINLPQRTVFLTAYDMASPNGSETEADLSTDSGWLRLASFVREYRDQA
jgi:hypothetical protein